MLKLVLVASFIALSSALIQCPTDFCDRVDCNPVDVCDGRLSVKGGFCGCCDVCMTQLGQGDSCERLFLLGVPPTMECGQGLHCNQDTRTCEKTARARRAVLGKSDGCRGQIGEIVGSGWWDAPCTKRLNEIRLSQQNGLPLIGVQEPKCDTNGFYTPVQCYGSVCYCVDNMGTEIDGFQVSIGNTADMNCQCALDMHAYMKTGLIGKLFYCDTNGNYKQNQVPATTMMPVIAVTQTQTGSEVTGGVLTGAQIAARGVCAKALVAMQGSNLLGMFVPECDADGKYAPRQCQGSECYCVRKDGTKIDGYSAPIAQKDHVTCQCARDKDMYASMGLLGRIHTCRQNGNYQQYQCLGSVCYCTDDMGNRLEANSVNIGDINNLKCE